ncbi:restriction endonuclease subunit S [Veillonella sp. 3891]|uniref:restriction endonuclease subunit S n=1 Tax=Veillonella sp. 3891 TaxID=2490951 RepID=UPI000F8D8718|nr:restriction endonuclease subunit S [Veillonella sp. 3891]
MSETKRNVPKLRFPGFTEDWEQRKLGEILKVNSGKDYKHLENGDIPVYGTGGYMLSVNEALSDIDAIGIGRKGTIDKPQYLKAPFWTVDTLFYLVPLEKYSCPLLYHLSNLIPWKKFDESTGVPSLSKSTIDGIQVNIPKDKKEQDRISMLFDRINNLITLHQRKLENLKLKKKALLQKLFPKNGEQFPELRFPGFTDAWEQRKLGEVASLRGGYAFKSGKFLKKGIPVIRISNILSDGIVGGEFAHYYEEEMEENFIVKDKSILIAMSGATTGKVGILHCEENQKFYQNQRVGYFEPNDQWSYKFIGTFVKSKLFEKQLDSVLVAGAQPNISSRDINDFDIWIPNNINEQNQIGVLFESFDNLITLHQRKLEHLQLQKKALLQQMFV